MRQSRLCNRASFRNLSAKNVGEGFCVEPNQDHLADLQSRSTEISSWAKHHLDEGFVIRAIFFEIDTCDFLPLGYQQFCHSVQQIEGIGTPQSYFAGVDFFSNLNISGRKKLLRAGAGRSALSVITPLNLLFGHQ